MMNRTSILQTLAGLGAGLLVLAAWAAVWTYHLLTTVEPAVRLAKF